MTDCALGNECQKRSREETTCQDESYGSRVSTFDTSLASLIRRDRKYHAMLTPNYPMGCKRIILDPGKSAAYSVATPVRSCLRLQLP